MTVSGIITLYQIRDRKERRRPLLLKPSDPHIPNSGPFPPLDISLQILLKLAQSPIVYPTVPNTAIALNMLQQPTNQVEITTTSLALETGAMFPSRKTIISRVQAFHRQLRNSLTIKLATAIPGFEMQDHGRGRDEEFVAAEAFDLFRHMGETMLENVLAINPPPKKRGKPHTALRFCGLLKYCPHFRQRLCLATSCSSNLHAKWRCRKHRGQ